LGNSVRKCVADLNGNKRSKAVQNVYNYKPRFTYSGAKKRNIKSFA
jgi:hypothetical protein